MQNCREYTYLARKEVQSLHYHNQLHKIGKGDSSSQHYRIIFEVIPEKSKSK